MLHEVRDIGVHEVFDALEMHFRIFLEFVDLVLVHEPDGIVAGHYGELPWAVSHGKPVFMSHGYSPVEQT